MRSAMRMPMRQVRRAWPNGWPSVMSRANESAENTSATLTDGPRSSGRVGSERMKAVSARRRNELRTERSWPRTALRSGAIANCTQSAGGPLPQQDDPARDAAGEGLEAHEEQPDARACPVVGAAVPGQPVLALLERSVVERADPPPGGVEDRQRDVRLGRGQR